MGEEYKTELEIELEKALDERGIYFSLEDKDLYKRLRELDLAQYPEPPLPTEDLDEEDLEFLPEALKEYKKHKKEEYKKESDAWAKKVGKKGILAWLEKGIEMLAQEIDESYQDRGIPYKFSDGGVYKRRFAEIGDFAITYGVACDREHPGPAYNKESIMVELIKLSKANERILDISFKNQEYAETDIQEEARNAMEDISELRILKRKYAHMKKVEPRHVVKDLMELIGA